MVGSCTEEGALSLRIVETSAEEADVVLELTGCIGKVLGYKGCVAHRKAQDLDTVEELGGCVAMVTRRYWRAAWRWAWSVGDRFVVNPEIEDRIFVLMNSVRCQRILAKLRMGVVLSMYDLEMVWGLLVLCWWRRRLALRDIMS